MYDRVYSEVSTDEILLSIIVDGLGDTPDGKDQLILKFRKDLTPRPQGSFPNLCINCH